MTNLTLEELMNQISKWQIEADSEYNDGWTRQHYQEKIDHIRSALNKVCHDGETSDSLDNYD